MSTEGLTTRGGMTKPKKSKAKTTKAAAATAVVQPRPKVKARNRNDIYAIVLLGVAVIIFMTLVFGKGGVVGNGVTGVLRYFFGQGAWAIPGALVIAAACLLRGRAPHQAARVSWGTVLILLGVLGVVAKDQLGDFFDQRAIEASGGVIGAAIGWAGHELLGNARGVGHAVMILTGLVLCVERPLHELILEHGIFGLGLKREVEEVDVEALAPNALADNRTRATVEMLQKSLRDEDEDDVLPVIPARRTAVAPIIRDNSTPMVREVELDTTADPAEGYKLPPTHLLAETSNKNKRDPKEIQKNIEILVDTLEQFNIDATVSEVSTGPTITRYEITLGPGIRVNRITGLADNIAMSLAASHVRVEAPIPGKSAIGVEVPTSQRTTVTLREMVESLEFHDNNAKLQIALGRDVSGIAKYTDLTRMPHLLIGGATNSGKSICMVSLIMSLIMKMTPKDLRLVMIDPKRVELTLFEGLPHLMCPVVKDVKEAAGVLRAVVREMDRRLLRFSEAAVRNIDGWNNKANYQDKMPFIVVIVDELADLMIQCGNEVETSICRLAQLARATGIHLVIATQRPSVDVITGTIKNNIASRIAFAVSSNVDSRTILDQAGADKLIGRGDMLFLPIDQSKPVRIQGCYVSEKEIEDVCDFWRDQEKPHYVLNPIQIAIEERESEMHEQQTADPLFEDICRHVVDRGECSTSMVQRKFAIGFQRASRLVDLMQERGIVGPLNSSKKRDILVDQVRLEQMLGNTAYNAPMADSEWLGDD